MQFSLFLLYSSIGFRRKKKAEKEYLAIRQENIDNESTDAKHWKRE